MGVENVCLNMLFKVSEPKRAVMYIQAGYCMHPSLLATYFQSEQQPAL